jgi:DNA-binding transcriptional ArsR family regulator
MKEAAPDLLPLLRSRTQGEILAWIILHPDQQFSLVEIARAVGTSPPTVKREVDRLVAAGIVSELRRGNTRLIQAETDNAVYGPLAELMSVTFGPIGVLRELLAMVPGIESAFIYGSWAARYSGEAGAVPRDIDVMVVGTPDRGLLDRAVDAAEQRLRREVNVRRVSPETWSSDGGSFKQTVLSRPTVALIGEHDG